MLEVPRSATCAPLPPCFHRKEHDSGTLASRPSLSACVSDPKPTPAPPLAPRTPHGCTFSSYSFGYRLVLSLELPSAPCPLQLQSWATTWLGCPNSLLQLQIPAGLSKHLYSGLLLGHVTAGTCSGYNCSLVWLILRISCRSCHFSYSCKPWYGLHPGFLLV